MKISACCLVSEAISELRDVAPHSVAMRFRDRILTYRQLDLEAEKLAGYLIQLGVTPGDAVALCLERSFEWIVAALAIMLAGAAYVPLDLAWPDERIRFALQDSGATVLVARTGTLNRLQAKAVGVDPCRDADLIDGSRYFKPFPVSPESLAYVIYTSGSTGVPKGVEITHANLNHLIRWHNNAFHITSQDRASHLAGLAFDAAVWEIWPHLSAGATLCLAEDTVRASPEQIQKWMIREGVTIGFVPTVHAGPLLRMHWPATTELRYLLTGGEALHQAPMAQLPFHVVNNYGPTECTVASTSGVVVPGSSGVPSIGRPIEGASIYLLDEEREQVADGEVGEIWIGGEGVGRGYRNLPDATQESFLPDPFTARPGARMYRSGDRGLLKPNGEIEFRGRVDRQAKIRGQRVELDEVAAVLGQHPAVSFAAVSLDASDTAENQLVAYLLVNGCEQGPTLQSLQEHLLRSLPQYMLPAIFVRLFELPLSPNGKLDLSLLSPTAGSRILAEEIAKPPKTPIEEKLLGLVRTILRNEAVGTEDNFFLAGGHSLLGMQLIMRIRNMFGIDLTLRQLFEAPTVESLSSWIERKLAQERVTEIWHALLGVKRIGLDVDFFELGGNEALIAELQRRVVAEFGRPLTKADLLQSRTVRKQAELTIGSGGSKLGLPAGVVALQPRGSRSRIFWLHYPCPNLAMAMSQDHPFFYVTITDDDFRSLDEVPSLEGIASCLVAKILATQTEGPYILGGFCLGGILSFEVASQMRAAGHEVSLLVMLDTPSPPYYWPAEWLTLIRNPRYLCRRMRQLGPRKTAATLLLRLGSRGSEKTENRIRPVEGNMVQTLIEYAASRYKPRKYDGDVVMIVASEPTPEHPPHEDFLPWWKSHVSSEVQTQCVKGQHLDMSEGPAVPIVAEAITSSVRRLEVAMGYSR